MQKGYGVPSVNKKRLRRIGRFVSAGKPFGSIAALRARLGGKTVRHVLILSDGRASTSEEQFSPLIRHRQAIARTFGIVFDFDSTARIATLGSGDLDGFAAVGLKLDWRTPAAEAGALASRLFSLASASGARKLVFDGDDDQCVLWPALLEGCDAYIKKHRFTDDANYMRPYVGKSNLTDYAHRVHGVPFDQDPIPACAALRPEAVAKIVLGWNIGLDDWIADLSCDLDPALVERPRDIDIGCRASVPPHFWTYGMRNGAVEAINALSGTYRTNAPTNRVPREEYYDEMLRARLTVSPFGFGELCWRDFESILCGSVLVKQDMSHIATWPDLFVPHETYIPVRWDFSDLGQACEPYLRDESARLRIARTARARLLQALEQDSFLDRFAITMRAAGLIGDT